MLSWNIKSGVIHDLNINGENIINPWGVETADSWAFFSLEKGVGYRHVIKDYKESITENIFNSTSHVQMKEGEWILTVRDEIVDNKIIRKAKLLCLDDSYFMDFVVRFRFKREFFDKAMIAGKIINHDKRNIYHQYPVKEATLSGEKFEVKLKVKSAECLGKFTPNLYVRDQVNEWVVHARMIPRSEDKIVIKLCSRYFKTSPLPEIVTRWIFKIKGIKEYLWYRGEHSPYKNAIAKFFSPNAFPFVFLKKGQEISWELELEVDRR